MTDLCDFCKSRSRVDGWRWCSSCGEQLARDRTKERRRRQKEGKQAILAHDKVSKSLLSFDSDEQVGGQARVIRQLEDG